MELQLIRKKRELLEIEISRRLAQFEKETGTHIARCHYSVRRAFDDTGEVLDCFPTFEIDLQI